MSNRSREVPAAGGGGEALPQNRSRGIFHGYSHHSNGANMQLEKLPHTPQITVQQKKAKIKLDKGSPAGNRISSMLAEPFSKNQLFATIYFTLP